MALWHRLPLRRRPAGIGGPPQLLGIFSAFPAHISAAHRLEEALDVRIGAVRPFEMIRARRFSAIVQAKPKPAGDTTRGPRLNGAISSPYIRLVSEQGHTVVSRQEALNHATRLNLDLVEVQRNADPPVCKIMDFHKEKFKQEVKEKERAKVKSAASLRSGDNKEVRFKAKTELKDLKTKAETITRLMDRGYRVKCTAMPIGKDNEDLGELLLRLLSLLQDVAVVESGPHVDTTKAYAIVRHVKFTPKKSGKKVGNVADIVSRGVQSVVPTTLKGSCTASQDEMALQSGEEWEQIESSSDAESEINSTSLNVVDGRSPKDLQGLLGFDVEADLKMPNGRKANGSDQSDRKFSAASNKGRSEFNHMPATSGRHNLHRAKQEIQTEKVGKGSVSGMVQQTEPSSVASNRYMKQSKVLPSQQRMPLQPARNTERRGQVDVAYRQRPPSVPGSPSSFGGSTAPGTRISDGQMNSGGRTTNVPNNATWAPPRGDFMAQRGSTDQNNKTAGAAATKTAPAAKTSDSSSSSASHRIFNSSKPFSSDEHRSDRISVHGDSLNPSTSPRFGIFSATHSSSSSDHDNVKQEVSGGGTPPRYGIFSSAKSSLSGEQRRP